MKKNLLSILILALLIVNIVLTAIMMFSVTSASKKTAKLVDSIAAALDLELSSEVLAGTEVANVAITDTVVYNISDSMTIPLKDGADGESHFCMVSVSFSINSKADDFKTYGSDLSAQESLIKSEINSVIGSYTLEEAKNNQELMREEILERIQIMYNSDFIFNVAFSDIVFQ